MWRSSSWTGVSEGTTADGKCVYVTHSIKESFKLDIFLFLLAASLFFRVYDFNIQTLESKNKYQKDIRWYSLWQNADRTSSQLSFMAFILKIEIHQLHSLLDHFIYMLFVSSLLIFWYEHDSIQQLLMLKLYDCVLTVRPRIRCVYSKTSLLKLTNIHKNTQKYKRWQES